MDKYIKEYPILIYMINKIGKYLLNTFLFLVLFYQILAYVLYLLKFSFGMVEDNRLLNMLWFPINEFVGFLVDCFGKKIGALIILAVWGLGDYLIFQKLVNMRLPNLLKITLYFFWGIGVLLFLIGLIAFFSG